MSARTGAEYLAGLKEQPREIWLDGRRIDDVTEFPGLSNGARSIAALSRTSSRQKDRSGRFIPASLPSSASQADTA